MESLLQDLRYALRTLRRAPAFTAVAVLSLGLGIGVNTTIFSAASALLDRGIPAADPHRLVRVYRNHHSPLSWRELRYYQQNATTFSDIIGERLSPFGVAEGAGVAERRTGAFVTGNFWSALGLRPAVGQLFAGTAEQAPGSLPVVVLSHRWWQRRFGGDSSVVGRTLRLNNVPMTVVGVAPAGFASSVMSWGPDFWVPITESPSLIGLQLADWGGSLYTTARLRPGVDVGDAQAEINTLTAQLIRADSVGRSRMTVRLDHSRGINAEMRQPVAVMSGGLLAVTGLVLLIACANVANLLLARAASRQREVAVRLAVGAGRARLVRQLLTESVLLALAGGALGLLLAMWATDFLTSLLPSNQPIAFDVSPDRTVLAYSLLLSVGTGILFGLAPALRASRPDLITSLRDGRDAGGYRRSRLRSGLVVAQVTLCMVLLVGASLFTHSLAKARVIDPGFETRGIVDLAVDLGVQRYDSVRGPAFYRTILERAAQIPGVEAATMQEVLPLSGSNMETRLWLPGRDLPAGERAPSAYFNRVGPRYFETFRVPMVRGRDFGDADREGAPLVAIVNETMARRLWPNQDAIGQRLSLSGDEGPYLTVVGVAKDTKYLSLGESPRTFLFLPAMQDHRDEMTVHVRTAGEVNAARRALADLARAMDPALPLGEATLLVDDMKIALVPAQAGAGFLGTFGLLALLLATVGIYGVTSYAVAQRTREIGVRTALGAQRRDVLRLVVGDSMRLVVLGAALGLAGAVGVGKAVASLLYGVGATDPLTFIGTPLVLALVALLAAYLPARHAARVDPMVALRYE